MRAKSGAAVPNCRRTSRRPCEITHGVCRSGHLDRVVPTRAQKCSKRTDLTPDQAGRHRFDPAILRAKFEAISNLTASTALFGLFHGQKSTADQPRFKTARNSRYLASISSRLL